MVASDEDTYKQYIAKTVKANINADVMNEIKGKSTAFYVNIESLFNGFAETVKGSQDTIWYSNFKNVFKDMIATSDNFDGTKTHAEFKIRMKDEKQNSLVSIIKTAEKISEEEKKNNSTVISQK